MTFIWASSTLNFARHDLHQLIAKIGRSLNPGGVFISFRDGMAHDRTQPDLMLMHLADSLRVMDSWTGVMQEIFLRRQKIGKPVSRKNRFAGGKDANGDGFHPIGQGEPLNTWIYDRHPF